MCEAIQSIGRALHYSRRLTDLFVVFLFDKPIRPDSLQIASCRSSSFSLKRNGNGNGFGNFVNRFTRIRLEPHCNLRLTGKHCLLKLISNWAKCLSQEIYLTDKLEQKLWKVSRMECVCRSSKGCREYPPKLIWHSLRLLAHELSERKNYHSRSRWSRESLPNFDALQETNFRKSIKWNARCNSHFLLVFSRLSQKLSLFNQKWNCNNKDTKSQTWSSFSVSHFHHLYLICYEAISRNLFAIVIFIYQFRVSFRF